MAKVKPIPDGYGAVTPSLNLKNAAAAIDFYKRAFGAKERMRMPGPDGGVMHAELEIGGSVVMIGEAMQQPESRSTMYLYVKDVDSVVRRATEAGAKATMPVTDMFWGDRMGNVTDPFGQSWSVATRKENPTPAEMKKRQKAFMESMARQ